MNTISCNSELIKINDPDLIWPYLNHSNNIQYFWLGRQSYDKIWELQKQLHQKRILNQINDVVILLEHEHVYTFGKNADKNYLLDSRPSKVPVIQIDRGGEVTYHGPGQIVCYPIIDLHNYKMSITWYMRMLEDVIIRCLEQLSINSIRKESLTGVWVDDNKICAMGVRLSKWVTMHGFALNLNPDMNYFNWMIPCGIFEYGVTSIDELDVEYSLENILIYIIESFDYFLSTKKNEI